MSWHINVGKMFIQYEEDSIRKVLSFDNIFGVLDFCPYCQFGQKFFKFRERGIVFWKRVVYNLTYQRSPSFLSRKI